MKKNNVAIFASGAGSNTRKIISYFENSKNIEIALILTNNSRAGVLKIAKETHTPSCCISKEELSNETYLIDRLTKHNIQWIILAGFLWKIPEYLIEAFPRHIINVHPSLLPKYGGKGMYGKHVHEAVLAAGEKESGITIHYIDKHYDKGETILQKKCAIQKDDTAQSLAEKVHALEYKWLSPTIEKEIKKTESIS